MPRTAEVVRTCRECPAVLTDANWLPSLRKNGNYICRDCWRERGKARRKADPEIQRRQNAAHYERNTEKIKVRTEAWRKANPEKYRQHRRRRRRLERAAKRAGEPYDDIDIFVRDNQPVDPVATDRDRPTIDHVIALCRGGVDAPHNVQLAHSHCNDRKGKG